jgi:hypothetical protein
MGQHQSLVDLGLALGLLLLLDFPFLLSFLFGYYTIHWEDHSLSDFCCGAIFHQFYVNVKMWVDSTALWRNNHLSEKQVQELRAPYVTTVDTAVDEHTLEQFQVRFPPYFDRFLEERDRRVASELERLEAAVEHNGAKITHLLREIGRRFTKVQEEMDRRFTEVHEEMNRRFIEVHEEMDRHFAEAQKERKLMRAEMRSQFRWTIGLLFPLVAGMLAIIIRVFLVGTF